MKVSWLEYAGGTHDVTVIGTATGACIGERERGYGHRLIFPYYTVSTKLYRLLQSNVLLIQDMVGDGC